MKSQPRRVEILIGAVIALVVLEGCGLAKKREADEAYSRVQAQVAEAMSACSQRFPQPRKVSKGHGLHVQTRLSGPWPLFSLTPICLNSNLLTV
jgi:hypothetical protein